MMDIQFVASSTMKGEVVILFVLSVFTYLLSWPFNNFGGDILTFCRCEECCRVCCNKCCKKKQDEKIQVGAPVSPNIGLYVAYSMLTVLAVMIAQTIYMTYARDGHEWERNPILFIAIGLLTGLIVGLLLKWFTYALLFLSGAALLYIVSVYSDNIQSLNNIVVLVGVFLVLGLLFLMRSCLQNFFTALVLTIISSFASVYSVFYFKQTDFTEYTVATNDVLGVSTCWQDRSGCALRSGISLALIGTKLIVIGVWYILRSLVFCCHTDSNDHYRHLQHVPATATTTTTVVTRKKKKKPVLSKKPKRSTSAAPAAAAIPKTREEGEEEEGNSDDNETEHIVESRTIPIHPFTPANSTTTPAIQPVPIAGYGPLYQEDDTDDD